MTPPLKQQWTHDMKNQIGIVLGFSELLLEGLAPDDPRRADAQEIHDAACRALELLMKGADALAEGIS